MKNNICVLGSGAWGTALADLLANNGHRVRIYGVCDEEIEEINTTHTNTKYFNHSFIINQNIVATNNFSVAIEGADIIVLAVPSFAIKENIQKEVILCA